MTSVIAHPPEPLNEQGRPRRVGVEIEFGGIEVGDAAAMVQDLYGGTLREAGSHRLEIVATRFGDFGSRRPVAPICGHQTVGRSA